MRSVVVTAADVSLFHVAAAQLGDATQWWRIALANGLTDPMLSGGPTTLSVPDVAPSTGDGLPPQE